MNNEKEVSEALEPMDVSLLGKLPLTNLTIVRLAYHTLHASFTYFGLGSTESKKLVRHIPRTPPPQRKSSLCVCGV